MQKLRSLKNAKMGFCIDPSLELIIVCAVLFLEATSVMGTFSFIPGIDYKIINATLLLDKKNPSLTIYGERPTTEHL